MPKHMLIVNPWAGRGAGLRDRPRIEAAMAQYGLDYDLVLTAGPGDGIELARQAADSYDVVVAVGGDGTVQEVANGLMQASGGQRTSPLGVIPIGSGDDFTYALGFKRGAVEEAVARLAGGRQRVVDVGRVNGRYFVNEVAVGFAAQAALEAKTVKLPVGQFVYLVGLGRAMVKYPSPRIRMRWAGGEVSDRLLMASIANGRRTGGGFLIAPTSDIADGVFDLVYAGALSRFHVVRLLPKVARGTHLSDPSVRLQLTPWVTIEAPSGMPVHVDGEILGTNVPRLDIEIVPGGATVIV
ncbi:MAG: diacylglycerol kinase family protein [Anaerolineae bacterium]